jgi:hypothetical protein
MQVWIMETGSAHEGGNVQGVYAAPELAYPDFEREARQLLQMAAAFNATFNPHRGSPIDVAEKGDDGSLRLQAAGDYITLTPHNVVVAADTANTRPLTAHPAYAYSPRQGSWNYGRHHARLDQPLTVGRLSRAAGDALCKPNRDFWGLEPVTTSPVDCPRCLSLAERYGVEMTDRADSPADWRIEENRSSPSPTTVPSSTLCPAPKARTEP